MQVQIPPKQYRRRLSRFGDETGRTFEKASNAEDSPRHSGHEEGHAQTTQEMNHHSSLSLRVAVIACSFLKPMSDYKSLVARSILKPTKMHSSCSERAQRHQQFFSSIVLFLPHTLQKLFPLSTRQEKPSLIKLFSSF